MDSEALSNRGLNLMRVGHEDVCSGAGRPHRLNPRPLARLRIPEQADHEFRSNPSSDSGAKRPPIPGIPSCHSGGIRPPEQRQRWMT
jgi:hypothetical protein